MHDRMKENKFMMLLKGPTLLRPQSKSKYRGSSQWLCIGGGVNRPRGKAAETWGHERKRQLLLSRPHSHLEAGWKSRDKHGN